MWASFDFLWLKEHRTKFEKWCKKFDAMDELLVEFELRKEEVPALEPWYNEVEQKYDAMKEFKKKFQKYNLGVDTSLKKVRQKMCGCTCKIHELNMVHLPHMLPKWSNRILGCNDSIGYVLVNVLGWWVVSG